MNIDSLFIDQVKKKPENVALFFENSILTYKELDANVTILARRLEKNSKNITNVGLLFRNPINFVIAALASMRAGLCYVPLSEKMPQNRIKFISQDCELGIILSDFELSNLEIKTQNQIFNYTNDLNYDDYCTCNKTEKNLDERNAYIIYTSGSTGTPKGVPITHNSICNTLIWRKNEYEFDELTVQLQSFSFIFDGSISSLFSVLISGGTIVLVQEKRLGDIIHLKALIKNQGVTNLFMVPSLLSALLDIVDESDFESIKCITTGGEKLQKAILDSSVIKNNKIEIVNEYGPTENSVTSTFLRGASLSNYGNIGYPILGCSIIIVDNGEEVEQGKLGELCVSGPGLTIGYLNRDDLNSKAFFVYNGKRYYRTGDIVEQQLDGSLKFIGRKDYQVKLNGYRIELEEIESTILECNLITNTAVIVKNNRLIAFYSKNVSAGNRAADLIKETLKKKLPNYMVPSVYIELGDFPTNLSGKIDRTQLQNFDININSNFVAPTTNIEKEILKVWQKYIQDLTFGITDNLFELGGNSLIAGRILGNLNKKYNVQLKFTDIFNNPTIKNLACILNNHLKEKERTKYKTVRQKDLVSESQKGIYFYQQKHPASTAYNNPFYIELPHNVDNNTIEVAYNRLLLSQYNLRKSFTFNGSEIVSSVREFCYQALEVCSIYRDIEEQLKCEVTSFDLANEQLIRGKIFQNNTNKFLFIDIHHIVFDGESLNIFLKDLHNFLDVNYVERKNDNRESEVVSSSVNQRWWKSYIESGFLRPSCFKTEIEEMTKIKYREEIKLSKGVINRLSKDNFQNITNNSILLSIFLLTLSRFLQENDLLVGIPFNTRNLDDDLIGMYVNTLPFDFHIDESKNVKELFYDVQNLTLSLYENKEINLEDILNQVKEKNNTDFKNGLFNIVYSSQVYDSVNPLNYKLINHSDAKFPFNFTVTELSEDYLVRLEAVDFQNANQIVPNFLEVFEIIFQKLCKNIDQKICELEVYNLEKISKKEVGEIKDYKNLVEVFSNIVKKYPDKVALKFRDDSLTYEELDNYSNSLANILHDQGVGSGERIGIYLDKGIEFIISMLAVLKLGSCYVPIDTTYPDNRKKYIIKNSKLQAIIFNNQTFIEDSFEGIKVDINECEKEHSSFVSTAIDRNQSAYIIYTSGSTGNPKGVVISHKNILSLLFPSNNNFSFSCKDVWTAFHSFCFDFSVWEIYGALLYGGTLVIIPEEVAKNPIEFSNLIIREKVTVLNQTPSAFYVFSEVNTNMKYAYLRYVIFGGEKLNPTRLIQWNKQNPQVSLINMYGITEITVHATYKLLTNNDLLTSRSNIGKVLDTLGYIVLDQKNHIVPRGVIGELYLYGHGISKGYFNNEQLTSERFTKSPYIDNALLYKTGDLVIERETGELEYIDRIDSQVKIRGYRIELGEIERVLCKNPLVNNCKVVVDRNNNLICFVESRNLVKKDIISFAKKNLTSYMQPSQFIILEKFPMTHNGKVDTTSLKNIYKHSMDDSYVEERFEWTEEQQNIKDIWSSVLGIHNFGPEDSFFDIGGHSLKVPQVIMRINSVLNTDISFVEFYANNTIKSLCKLIKRKRTRVESKSKEFCELIKMNKVQSQRKLFFVHGGNARISTYLELIKNDFFDWETFGIELYREGKIPNSKIECSELASRYIKLIRNQQKSGPYHIFGTCIGGTISFEIARQLEKIHEEKVFLYLASSEAPEKYSGYWNYNEELTDYLNHTFAIFNLTPQAGWDELQTYLDNNESLLKISRILDYDINNLEKHTVSELLHRKNLTFDLLQMRKHYYPDDVLESRVVYFNAIEQPIYNRKKWNNHCQNIYYVDVDGNHDSMFQATHCESIRRELKNELKRNEVME